MSDRYGYRFKTRYISPLEDPPMGLLLPDECLEWDSILLIKDIVKERGLDQFINVWNAYKNTKIVVSNESRKSKPNEIQRKEPVNRDNTDKKTNISKFNESAKLKLNGIHSLKSVDSNSKLVGYSLDNSESVCPDFLWGDELEFMTGFKNPDGRYRLICASDIFIDNFDHIQLLNVEYASYMLETTPKEPFSSTFEDLLRVEEDMLERLLRVLCISKSIFPESKLLSITCFLKNGKYSSYIQTSDVFPFPNIKNLPLMNQKVDSPINQKSELYNFAMYQRPSYIKECSNSSTEKFNVDNIKSLQEPANLKSNISSHLKLKNHNFMYKNLSANLDSKFFLDSKNKVVSNYKSVDKTLISNFDNNLETPAKTDNQENGVQTGSEYRIDSSNDINIPEFKAIGDLKIVFNEVKNPDRLKIPDMPGDDNGLNSTYAPKKFSGEACLKTDIYSENLSCNNASGLRNENHNKESRIDLPHRLDTGFQISPQSKQQSLRTAPCKKNSDIFCDTVNISSMSIEQIKYLDIISKLVGVENKKLSMFRSTMAGRSENLTYIITQSTNFPDNAITKHKRFESFTKNIVQRRGRKLEGYINLFLTSKCLHSCKNVTLPQPNLTQTESICVHKKNSGLNCPKRDRNDKLREKNSQETLNGILLAKKSAQINSYTSDRSNGNLQNFAEKSVKNSDFSEKGIGPCIEINADELYKLQPLQKLQNISIREYLNTANKTISDKNTSTFRKDIQCSIKDYYQMNSINVDNLYDQCPSDPDNRNDICQTNINSRQSKNLINQNNLINELSHIKEFSTQSGLDDKNLNRFGLRESDTDSLLSINKTIPLTKNDSDDILSKDLHFTILKSSEVQDSTQSHQKFDLPCFDNASTTCFNNEHLENIVKIDSMGQGMGCCCLQVTLQANDLEECRYLYDMLGSISPLFLRLTRATPIIQGRLLKTETRWYALTTSVDCRTDDERGCAFTINGCICNKIINSKIPKSRYSSIDIYISNDPDIQKYNDIHVPINQNHKEKLIQAGVDEPMACHISSLFIRDPVMVYATPFYERILAKIKSEKLSSISKEFLKDTGKPNYNYLNSEIQANASCRKMISTDSYQNETTGTRQLDHDIIGTNFFGSLVNTNMLHRNSNSTDSFESEENFKNIIHQQTSFRDECYGQYDASDIIQTDDFENIQSSNWRSMRFKLPSQRGPASSRGWKVEFRTMEIQPTPFENTAWCNFIILLTKAIIQYRPNLYMPISKVDKNFEYADINYNNIQDYLSQRINNNGFEISCRNPISKSMVFDTSNGQNIAQKVEKSQSHDFFNITLSKWANSIHDPDSKIENQENPLQSFIEFYKNSILNNNKNKHTFYTDQVQSIKQNCIKKVPLDRGHFYYRKNIFDNELAVIEKGTIEEIFFGKDDYIGLFNLVSKYIDEFCKDQNTKNELNKYMMFISGRIKGLYMCVADYMRYFVINHKKFSIESDRSEIKEEILDDLMDKIALNSQKNDISYLRNFDISDDQELD